MRISFFFLILVLLMLPYGTSVHAQMNTFTTNLSLGSEGTQVVALQKLLNQDLATRIAVAGVGSPGNETSYFGLLTKAAVIRFQEKYVNTILTPAGLIQGNGYVGSYTRAKLNALFALAKIAASTTPSSIPEIPIPSQTPVATSTDYRVTVSEKINIYAGDALIATVQKKILDTINTAITSGSADAVTLPVIALADVPSVALGTLSPQSGVPGTHVSITGSGILSNSVVYFGNDYVVRTLGRDLSGTFSFVIPPIPPARYDIAIKTGGAVSNTKAFVITDPRNPAVHIQSVSPVTVAYGDTLTIIGSGFSPTDNIVVTRYKTFTNIPSPDGTTLSIQFTPEILQVSAGIGDGTRNIPISLSVVNAYGFSNSEKSFIMKL